MNRLLATTCAALVSTVCFAHSDTVLQVQADGRLAGLPAEYNPASLRISFSRSRDADEPPIASVELTLAGKTVVVPQCLTRMLHTRSMKDVRIVASWYHESSTLPHYVDVTLFDPGHEDVASRPGFKLLFNLSTAKLFKMEVVILRDTNSSQFVPVDVSALCPAAELQRFSESALRPNTSLERTRDK